jgi:F0F1-type ATP synthase membrane subunit c/vacuolar-type H+-ATPase subunit K
LGIATYLEINAKTVHDGDIVSFTNSGYSLSNKEYDALAIGVVTYNPAVAIVEQTQGAYAVLSTGNAYINVSGVNGSIKKGDLITTSTIPGIGIKATHSGYVVGTALDNFFPKNKNEVGHIPISLNVHYFASRITAKNNLFDIFNLTTIAAYEEPTVVFKYFVAGVTVITSFIFGFIFFGRAANKGIEALGRNPLAARMIQIGIFLNVIVTVAIIASGLLVAFLVLRL